MALHAWLRTASLLQLLGSLRLLRLLRLLPSLMPLRWLRMLLWCAGAWAGLPLSAAAGSASAVRSCWVDEIHAVGACSIPVKGAIADGGSRTFQLTSAGHSGAQTAACSNGVVVWLPGRCGSALAPQRPVDGTDAEHARHVPVSLEQLRQFSADARLAHEDQPQGVPSSYSWQAKPVKDHWNRAPVGYTAITGWSQAFWRVRARAASAKLQVQRHQTFVCHGQSRTWVQVQRPSAVEGAQFQPDYVNNANVAPPFFASVDKGNVLGWSLNQAFHFWPLGGRGALPQDGICGVLVLLQARALPDSPEADKEPRILLGLGADYWLNASAPWAQYKTNAALGVGRLKLVGTDWAWYGFTTASDEDLAKLFYDGFETARP